MFFIVPYKNYMSALCSGGNSEMQDAVEEQIRNDKFYIQDTKDLVIETVNAKRLQELLDLNNSCVEGLTVENGIVTIYSDDFNCLGKDYCCDYAGITVDTSLGGISISKGSDCCTLQFIPTFDEDDLDDAEYGESVELVWLVKASNNKYYKYIRYVGDEENILLEGIQFVKTKKGYDFICYDVIDIDNNEEIVNIGLRLDKHLNLVELDCPNFIELSDKEVKEYAKKKLLG